MTRFKELINLYLDRALTPDERALLKKEIQTDAQKKKLFKQYCQLHEAACIALSSPRPKRAISAYWGLAVACVAVTFSLLSFYGYKRSTSALLQATVFQSPPQITTAPAANLSAHEKMGFIKASPLQLRSAPHRLIGTRRELEASLLDVLETEAFSPERSTSPFLLLSDEERWVPMSEFTSFEINRAQ